MRKLHIRNEMRNLHIRKFKLHIWEIYINVNVLWEIYINNLLLYGVNTAHFSSDNISKIYYYINGVRIPSYLVRLKTYIVITIKRNINITKTLGMPIYQDYFKFLFLFYLFIFEIISN